MHIFSTSMKDHAFSRKKVVIKQFDSNRWFYTAMYAKWLSLKAPWWEQNHRPLGTYINNNYTNVI